MTVLFPAPLPPSSSLSSPPPSSFPPTRPPKRPRKKPTAVARREEKLALLKELDVLRAWKRLQQQRLKHRETATAVVTSAVHSARTDAVASVSDKMVFDESTLARADTFLQLRGAVRNANLQLAGLQGMLSARTAQQYGDALHTPLRLCADPIKRHETLRECHTQKIYDADAFIRARCTGMDLLTPFSSTENFQDPATGDLCAVYFEVTQFPGITSVHQVYDALRFWSSNLEICVSEHLGTVTVREDTEDDEINEPTPDGEAYVSVRRIRSTIPNCVSSGASQAVFAQVVDRDDGDGHVVLTLSPVASDALYPCHSDTDVQIEATGVMRVEKVASRDDCVVLTRWARIRFRRNPERNVTPAQQRAVMTTGIGRWFEVFQCVMWEQLYMTAPRTGEASGMPQPALFDML